MQYQHWLLEFSAHLTIFFSSCMTDQDNGELVVKGNTLTVTVIKCLQYCNTILIQIVCSCYVHVCLCMCVRGQLSMCLKGTTVEPLYK